MPELTRKVLGKIPRALAGFPAYTPTNFRYAPNP